MGKLAVVLTIMTTLIVAAITPAQAHEEGPEPPDASCPEVQVENPDAQVQLETWEVQEIQFGDREHSLLHGELDVTGTLRSDLCVGSFCMVGIGTSGSGYCHDDIAYSCRECMRWETSGIEPFCPVWQSKICVHRGHCKSWFKEDACLDRK